MSIISKILSATVLMGLFSGAPALADLGDVYVTSVSTDPIVVVSNGSAYTQLKSDKTFEIRGWLEFDVGDVGGVKSWSASPRVTAMAPIVYPMLNIHEMKISKSYGVGNRPDEIGKNLVFKIPAATVETFAVGMCATLADQLRKGGKSDKEIFGKDRDLPVRVWIDAKVDSTGAGQGNQIWQGHEPFEIKLRCAKFAGAAVPQGGNDNLAAAPVVESATMKLTEKVTAGGLCRVDTVTALRGNRAGMTIKYRFVHSGGKKSETFSVKTEDNMIAVVSHNWDVPNEAGTENGWVRIEGVSPDFESNKASYSMNCKDKAPGGMSADTADVLKATMKLTEVPQGCKVKLVTAISTNAPNATITYRYVHSSGQKSPVYSTTTEANKIAVVSKTWDIPKGPGAETGWLRIEGVNTKFVSNEAAYEMSCPSRVASN